MMIHQDLLDEGNLEKLVGALHSIKSSNAELTKTISKEAEYFAKNVQRMQYPEFRRQHLFVGSGVVEAGCKTMIGSRCKGSGMFWRCVGPMPFWPCAAVILTIGSRTTGRRGVLESNFDGAHPIR